MNRQGLTLLEIVLATTLLTAVTVALGTWLRLTGRSFASAALMADQEYQWSAVRRLMTADLSSRVANITIDPDGRSLRVTTINALPGDTCAERTVLWSCSPDGLQRTFASTGTPDATTPKPLDFPLTPLPQQFVLDDSGSFRVQWTPADASSVTPPGDAPGFPLLREWH